MEVKHILIEFVEDQLPSYCNPGGVQLYLNPDDSLFLLADYPDIEQLPNINLELFQEFKSLKYFLEVLGLSRLEQLLKLTPVDLLALYDNGKMNIVCNLEGKIDREMSFRKYKRKIWTRDIHDKMHRVMIPIDQQKILSVTRLRIIRL